VSFIWLALNGRRSKNPGIPRLARHRSQLCVPCDRKLGPDHLDSPGRATAANARSTTKPPPQYFFDNATSNPYSPLTPESLQHGKMTFHCRIAEILILKIKLFTQSNPDKKPAIYRNEQQRISLKE
jgi:hypothetical protein